MSDPVFNLTSTYPFGLMSDVGFYAKPTFVDIDGDGDLDALIGNSDGNTLFFRNTGTASSPAFAADVTKLFGLSYVVGGHASPTFVDNDRDLTRVNCWSVRQETIFWPGHYPTIP